MVSNGGSVDMLFEIMQLQKTVGGERCEESWLAHGSRKSESLDATWHHSVYIDSNTLRSTSTCRSITLEHERDAAKALKC